MNKLTGKKPTKIRRAESGQALIIVLILLMIGSLALSPVLSLIYASLKNGTLYDLKMNQNYAAKSGIENGTWQIRSDNLKTLFHNPSYNEYDFSTVWAYTLSEQINNQTTNVTIQNIWLPQNVALPYPGDAQAIIESGKLIITGDTIQTGITIPGSGNISQYQIKITYYPGASENLTVASFGIWLPRGFAYYTDNSTHKSSLVSSPITGHPVTETSSPWAGNQAVIWSYSSPPAFSDFPTQGTLPVTANVTFYFKPSDQTQPGAKPCIVPWIKTANGGAYGIPYSWDADIKVYKVRSIVGSTTVETYFAKSELRQMQSAIAGDYYATGNSNLSAPDSSRNRTSWHDPSTAAVTGTNIPADADVAYAFLYWSGWKDNNSIANIFSDSCTTLPGNWTWSSSTSTWSVNSNYFQANYGGTHTVRDLTLASSRDLSAYKTGGVVTLSWNQWVTSSSGSYSDTRVPANDDSNTGGFTTSPLWSKIDETSPTDSDYITGVTDAGGRATFGFSSFNVPANATITNLTIYFRQEYASSGTAKAGATLKVGGNYYDNLGMVTPGSYWTTSSYVSTTNPATGLAWTAADINGTGANPLQKFGVSSNDFSPDVRFSWVNAQVNYTLGVSAADGLDYYLYDGTNWFGPAQAFRGNIGTSPANYSATVPAAYLTSGFKIKFSLVGFSSTGNYANLDNITIKGMAADNSVVFQIDDGNGYRQVSFTDNGTPRTGSYELTASKTQVLQNYSGTNSAGFSYSSYRDVTALVRKYSQEPIDPATNWPGYATYSVGGIYADTGGTYSEWAYANWSLIIVYTSEATQGHQLYLFDNFIYSNQDTAPNGPGVNVDFDGDGQPGGTISGFIVPNPVAGEINAAKMTCFVGEGDVWYPNADYPGPEYIAMNGVKLWDGTSTDYNSKYSPNNPFNSTSMGSGTYDGIDIDTLGIDPPNGQYITWASNILKPGDTSAQINMVTHIDAWNMIYIILSFRSKTTVGGILSYRIVN